MNKLIDEVYTNASGKIKEILEKKQKELKEFFGVEKLENYHYGLLLNNNPEKGVNEILEASSQATPPDEKGVNEVLINQDIVSISKTMYKNMGYDIEKLEKKARLLLICLPEKEKYSRILFWSRSRKRFQNTCKSY